MLMRMPGYDDELASCHFANCTLKTHVVGLVERGGWDTRWDAATAAGDRKVDALANWSAVIGIKTSETVLTCG